MAAFEEKRAVLLRDSEALYLEAFGEDTGVGDTMDVNILLRVVRRRNLG